MSDETVSAPTSPEEDVGDIKASIAQQTPTQPSQVKRRKKKGRKNATSLPGNTQILAARSEIVATGEQGTSTTITIEQLVQSEPIDTYASQIQRKRREKKKRRKDRKKEGEMKEGPDGAECKDEEDDSSSFDSVENGNDVDQEDEERNTPTAKESRGRNRFATLFKDTSELTRARRKRCVSSGSLADGASGGGWGMGGFVESTNKALLLPMRKISIPKLRSLYKYTTLGLTTELLLGTRSSESETSDSSDDDEDDLENTPPIPPNATNGQKRGSGDPPLDFLEVHADISESW